MTTPADVTIVARDGRPLAATVFPGGPRVVVINAAMAVPARFYRHLAAALQPSFTVVTWDYRDIGASRDGPLRGSDVTILDWATVDIPSVVDWVAAELRPAAVYFVGHSLGGQVAGMIDNPEHVRAMVTLSSQSGHWRLQGGEQKWLVGLHAYVTMPLLTRLVGYMPWSRTGGGEDLPPRVATEWAGWVRDRQYLLGDESLPLERYTDFTAPVLAFSIEDDKWGTAAAVDAMMSAYPNVERRHLVPRDRGIDRLGHTGYFRREASALWSDLTEWFDRH